MKIATTLIFLAISALGGTGVYFHGSSTAQPEAEAGETVIIRDHHDMRVKCSEGEASLAVAECLGDNFLDRWDRDGEREVRVERTETSEDCGRIKRITHSDDYFTEFYESCSQCGQGATEWSVTCYRLQEVELAPEVVKVRP